MSVRGQTQTPPPPCVQEVGYRGHPKQCGEPARFGLVERDGSGRRTPMCEAHAWICMDKTGAQIAVTYDLPSS